MVASDLIATMESLDPVPAKDAPNASRQLTEENLARFYGGQGMSLDICSGASKTAETQAQSAQERLEQIYFPKSVANYLVALNRRNGLPGAALEESATS